MTNSSHIHGSSHPVLCSLTPSSCHLLDAGSYSVLCNSCFPVLFPLNSLAKCHPSFLSNPGFPVPALNEVQLWFLPHHELCPPSAPCLTKLQLALPLHSLFPHNSVSTNIQLHLFFFHVLFICL